MKIILQRSVDNLGDPGDMVTVKDGYARNYLMPRGLAVPASKGATRHVESLKRSHDAKIAQLRGAVTSSVKGVSVSKKDVLLDEPIKSTGEHAVSVRLHPEVTAEVVVEVVGE